VESFNQRQGFLISSIVHLFVMMLLAGLKTDKPLEPRPEPPPAREPRQAVFLPPQEVLRQLIPRPASPRPATPPAPRPTPAAPSGKDRISVGPPSTQRAKGPLELRREDDLTAVPRGQPNAVPSAAPAQPAAPSPSSASAAQAQAEAAQGRPGLRLPPGIGRDASGEEGGRAQPRQRSIASSLRDLDRRLGQSGPLGLPTGTGQQMGPLFFDPEGADFTRWINQFKNEVYRNWILPQPALLGVRGHVDFQFTVERDGSVSEVKMLKSAGNAALDRAAQNALLGSSLLELPADFRPARVTMQVSFYYNEGPQGS
jgi:TonB family protein